MLGQQAELSRQQELLAAELRRSNLDRDLDRDQAGGDQRGGDQGGGEGGGGEGDGGEGGEGEGGGGEGGGGEGDAAAQQPDSGGGGSGSGRYGKLAPLWEARSQLQHGCSGRYWSSAPGQTRDVSARLIKGMPLYDGARQARRSSPSPPPP